MSHSVQTFNASLYAHIYFTATFFSSESDIAEPSNKFTVSRLKISDTICDRHHIQAMSLVWQRVHVTLTVADEDALHDTQCLRSPDPIHAHCIADDIRSLDPPLTTGRLMLLVGYVKELSYAQLLAISSQSNDRYSLSVYKCRIFCMLSIAAMYWLRNFDFVAVSVSLSAAAVNAWQLFIGFCDDM